MIDSAPDKVMFSSLNLDAQILRAIEEEGYTEPTPIQAQAIPHVLAGRDLMAMAPTRELAIQVEKSVETYSRHVALRSTVVFGGIDIKTQKPALAKGVEILVATPGRLLDHVESRNLMLNQVQILILDEADRMLDMGFMPDLLRILALLPKQRQTLLFSATFSDDIKKLAQVFLQHPVTVETARIKTENESVKQSVYMVEHDHKFHALTGIIRSREVRQVLVFTRTKLSAALVARKLAREGIS